MQRRGRRSGLCYPAARRSSHCAAHTRLPQAQTPLMRKPTSPKPPICAGVCSGCSRRMPSHPSAYTCLVACSGWSTRRPARILRHRCCCTAQRARPLASEHTSGYICARPPCCDWRGRMPIRACTPPATSRGAAWSTPSGRFHHGGGGALLFQRGKQIGSARPQESAYGVCLCGVARIGAALEAGSQTHFHFGVDAAGKFWIGRKIVHAAAQQEEVQHLFEKPLRRRA